VAKRLHVDAEAADELERARRYLDESRGLGGDLVDAFVETTARIREAPAAFPELRRTRSGVVVRSVLITRFHYRIVFADLARLVWVIAFAHDKQRPFYWAGRLRKPPAE